MAKDTQGTGTGRGRGGRKPKPDTSNLVNYTRLVNAETDVANPLWDSNVPVQLRGDQILVAVKAMVEGSKGDPAVLRAVEKLAEPAVKKLTQSSPAPSGTPVGA